VCEREDASRTREAGSLDEIQDVVANTLNLHLQGAVGFTDWLDLNDALAINRIDRELSNQKAQKHADEKHEHPEACLCGPW